MAFDTLPARSSPTAPPPASVDTEANADADTDWPAHGLVDDLLPVLADWAVAGHAVALATLVTVQGSAPRPAGSQMLVRDDGRIAGYVSGGCVEGAIAAEAVDLLTQGGASRFLVYGPGSPFVDVRLTCGGAIGVLVVALDAAALARDWAAARRARRLLWQSFDLATGRLDWGLDRPSDDGRFHRPLPPPLRLVLVGGDPVTLALATLAPDFGLECCVLRPHGPARPPTGTAVSCYDNRALEPALGDLALDGFSAVYTLSHDTDTDHRVLAWALASPAFCVGALGSRRRMDDARRRLRAAGLPESHLHAPAGVDLGRSDSPRQIALSILAEVTALRPRLAAGVATGAAGDGRSTATPGALAA